MSSIAHYLDPGLWRDVYQSSIDDLHRTAFWLAILQIILINILLSGDNAVVIAMACRGLPPRQRLSGLVIGAGVAVFLLIIFTTIVAHLMMLPYLKLVGGLALIYIAIKLLLPEPTDKTEMEVAAHLWRAVRIVVVADLIMSLDNIIALAAIARGDIMLLMIGLLVSIPVIIGGTAVIMMVLDRFPILVWAGAALLGWVAGGVMATDPVLSSHVAAAFGGKFARRSELAAAVAGAALVMAVGGLWRNVRWSKMDANVSGE